MSPFTFNMLWLKADMLFATKNVKNEYNQDRRLKG